MKGASYKRSLNMNTGCDNNTGTEVRDGARQNLDNKVPCRQGGQCDLQISTSCAPASRRRRNAPALRLSLVMSLNLGPSEVLQGSFCPLGLGPVFRSRGVSTRSCTPSLYSQHDFVRITQQRDSESHQ